MPRPRRVAQWLAIAVVVSRPALAHEAPGTTESSPEIISAAAGGGPVTGVARWRGSVVLFDQSISTQTVGIGRDYQSYDPTYEWWVAVKPRYTLFNTGTNALSLNLWLNAYLEITNSDTSTREREPQLGPTYLWAVYEHAFRERRGYRTSATIGPRVTLPTDKVAYDAGQIIGVGAIGSVSQTFRLAGRGARALRGARLGVASTFNHPFNRATSPVNGGLHQLREDLNGLSVESSLLSGSMMVKNSLSVALLGDLQILRKLDLSLSYVVINYWLYATPVFQDCVALTGCVTPMTNEDPATSRVNTWVTAALSYDLSDELSLSAGYYNLANQLAPYGTRRDPVWSPAARFFLSVTGNLDAIWEHFVPGPKPVAPVAEVPPVVRRPAPDPTTQPGKAP